MSRAPVIALVALVLVAARGSNSVASAQVVKVSGAKQLDFGAPLRCADGGESAFAVSSRDGIRPRLRIQVTLKPPPADTATDIQLRIELLDETGQVVTLLDSTQVQASTDPPWRQVQLARDKQHQFDLENRLPQRPRSGMPRYRMRVSLDTAKAGVETQTFMLYWPELGEQPCKRIG